MRLRTCFTIIILLVLAVPMSVTAQSGTPEAQEILQVHDTATPTNVATQETPAVTPTLPPSPTPSPTDTPSPTQTPTLTGTPTSTSSPVPGTLAPSPTGTPAPPTPTPTVTPIWPTDTMTPLPPATSTAGPACADRWEPNDDPGTGPVLSINQPINTLTLYPAGDIDFFLVWGKPGRHYQITSSTNQGVDTRVKVYDPLGDLIAENDDYQTGNPASQARFESWTEGWFMVTVDSRVPTAWECHQYTIMAVDVSAPTPTPTKTPGPPPAATAPATAVPGEKMYDDYEPNYDLDSAANLGVGQTLALNFNPWPAGSPDVDNDYFRFYAKVGEVLKLETSALAQGLDTNMILLGENGQVVAGNDDCREGDRSSCLEWAPDYTGVAYVVVGPVGAIPEDVSAGARTYQLTIKDIAGQPPTPGGTSPTPAAGLTPQFGLPWAVTPVPPTPAALMTSPPGSNPIPLTPLGTATPAVQVRQIPLPGLPTPTLPPLKLVTIGVSIYYDENNNKAPDASEGVSGVSIRLLDGANNSLMGQTFTNTQGYAALSVTAVSDVRLSIPYLGFNQQIRPPGEEVTVRLAPLRLPSVIP